jgi:GDP-L-fucose synthase
LNFNLHKDLKIYVAGHKGLIGSAFIRYFKANGYNNIITRSREELDLSCADCTDDFFKEDQPEVVILAAGKVGGILQNRDFPADFIFENLSIQLNIFKAAQKYHTKKLIFFGSSCMYPRDTKQPMKEEQLLSGKIEPTSLAYAISKYAGLQMCKAINTQNKSVIFIPIIPNSVYGINDNFDPYNAHVLSSLISRFHDAKEKQMPSVELWGTGEPKREFVYVDDLVEACFLVLKTSHLNHELPINIGVGEDISIKLLAEKISRIVGYSGNINWDITKPDGAPQKLLDSSRIESMNWKPLVNLDQGIEYVYKWYLDNK